MNEGMKIAARASSANRGFVAIVVISLIVHVGIIGGVVYGQARKPRLDVVRSSIPVQLVMLGKKRDPNLLPRKVVEKVAAAPEEEGVALQTKPDDKASAPTKKKEKLSNAAQRLLDGADTKLDRALDKIDDQEGDPDGSVHGTTTDATNAATGYQLAISKAIAQNYRLPETIPSSQRGFLKARVVLFIEPDGAIKRFEFVERHSNEMFMSALDSLLRTLKLPAPPASQVSMLRETGVEVLFRP